jgi:putative ABC transport system substrate-binding protein
MSATGVTGPAPLETAAASSICHAVDRSRRAAGHIAKVLRGTKASDLPIEQPIKFEFAINLKTAKTLDLVIPAALLTRAEKVIE